MERRHFLTKTAVAAGATAVALADAPNVIAQQRYQWRMSTTWTPALDVLQGAAQKMAKMVDDMCFIRSMHTEAINHEPAITYMQTGNQITGRPCLGAWASYGLGSLNENLPTFVVLPGRPPRGWACAFPRSCTSGWRARASRPRPRSGCCGCSAETSPGCASALNSEHAPSFSHRPCSPASTSEAKPQLSNTAANTVLAIPDMPFLCVREPALSPALADRLGQVFASFQQPSVKRQTSCLQPQHKSMHAGKARFYERYMEL